MARKRKLLTVESSQAQGVCPENTRDRFSDLPFDVAHHIVSFLTMRNLIRFGIVSKRCRDLCLTAPSLDFHGLVHRETVSCAERLKLLSSLDRYLAYRGDNKLKCFSICWRRHAVAYYKIPCSCEAETFRMITWILKAVRCRVEVLDIVIHAWDKETLAFPSSVFLSGSLRFLSLAMNCTILKAPSFTSFSNLEYLKLKDVKVVDEGFFRWISYSCICLKDLWLEDISGLNNVTIESLSLEALRVKPVFCHLDISGDKLKDISVYWETPSRDHSINISAPNIKHLKWYANSLTDQRLGNLLWLEEAEVTLHSKENDSNSFNFLWSLRRVKALTLNTMAIMALCNKDSMPISLDYACSLRMDIIGLIDDLVPAMVTLFRGFPNLSTLHIQSRLIFPAVRASGFSVEYWKLHDFAFIYELKEVTIELKYGFNAVEFARYILQHAKNLEKMVIHYYSHFYSVVRELKQSKTISNATVHLCRIKWEM